MTRFVGLDISQKMTAICIVDNAGRRLWRVVRYRCHASGFEAVAQRADAFQVASMFRLAAFHMGFLYEVGFRALPDHVAASARLARYLVRPGTVSAVGFT